MILLVLIAAVVLIRFAWMTFNRTVPLRAACRESESNIRVVNRKRETLIDSIVNQTEAYGRFEKDMLLRLSEDMRSSGSSVAINRLRDAYPNLLWNTRISEQLSMLSQLESELQSEIATYNYRVKQVNETLGRFPELIVAGLLGWRKEDYYRTT